MKRLSPLEEVFSILKELASGGINTAELRKDVFNTAIGDTVIDTCVAFDTNEWETGITQHGGSWVIVEQYEDRDKAQMGHDKWVKLLTKNPNTELSDRNLWNIPRLGKE